MSKKKVVIAVASLLVGAGAIAAISAPGPRGGHGRGWHNEDGHGGMERRGWFGREMTKDAFDTRVRERFAALDRNSDGVIDASEIEASVAQQRGGMMARWHDRRGGSEGAMGNPFGRLDMDRDGKATKDEAQARIRKAFAEADLDSDGKLTDADLPPMLRGQGLIARLAANDGMGGGIRRMRGHGQGSRGMHEGMGMGGGLGRLIQGAEVKDGAVTLDAALAAAQRRFDRFDRTKDGVLDKADAEIMRKDMTDYRVQRFTHAHGAKDGKVTREQFTAKAAERFAAMDMNGDGKLGRGEIGGRRSMHRDGHDNQRGDGPRGGGRGPGAPADAPKQ